MARVRLLLTLVLCLPLAAQPSLKELWVRHDAILLNPSPQGAPKPESSTHLFTGARGQQVRGWDVGESTSPAVLWWTGGPGAGVEDPDIRSWWGDYSKKMRSLVLDQPGVGDGTSAWVPGWRPEDSADDAEAFLRMRGVKGPVIVFGWSWGSTMALLFAQRHPERVRAVVVGGVWANSAAEVRRYLGANGTRAFLPGVAEAFASLLPSGGSACDLHAAIRDGKGGMALGKAYEDAEMHQCFVDTMLRTPLMERVAPAPGSAVDMVTCKDPTLRFAFIESEMMCRGERGGWKLELRFPPSLAQAPLVVIQGRFDQVCDPEVAWKVYKAWPGDRKRWVPLNAGHASIRGVTGEELQLVGLDPALVEKVNLALKVHLGSTGRMAGAALSLLAE
ncbi:MAG TPA: alpha/beta fold hydrolase [Holophagaceae bacterium]|nr:alpha/beta fold hydrolase [Holophagaceae bacterium]